MEVTVIPWYEPGSEEENRAALEVLERASGNVSGGINTGTSQQYQQQDKQAGVNGQINSS